MIRGLSNSHRHFIKEILVIHGNEFTKSHSEGGLGEIELAERLFDGIARERDLLLQTEVDRRGTDFDGVGAGIYSPQALAVALRVVAELLGIEFHADGLRLVRL